MNEAISALEAQARKLSPTDRLQLVDAILGSLDEPDPQIDALWEQEAEDRLAAWRRGDMKAIPMEEVMAKYRTP